MLNFTNAVPVAEQIVLIMIVSSSFKILINSVSMFKEARSGPRAQHKNVDNRSLSMLLLPLLELLLLSSMCQKRPMWSDYICNYCVAPGDIATVLITFVVVYSAGES